MTAQHFSELVETFRQTKGWKLDVVANILGVSRATLIRWKINGVPTATAVKIDIGGTLRRHVRGV